MEDKQLLEALYKFEALRSKDRIVWNPCCLARRGPCQGLLALSGERASKTESVPPIGCSASHGAADHTSIL